MTFTNWIQLGLLIAALATLIVQQHRANANAKRNEKRTANKLKIFYICQAEQKTEEEIFREFKQRHPTENIDEVEIRKTIYEMLTEETLRYRSDLTYRARRNKATTTAQDDN
jgi:hypothetical protein